MIKTKSYWVLILVLLAVPMVAFAQMGAPVLRSLSPPSAVAGGGRFTLIASGSNFLVWVGGAMERSTLNDYLRGYYTAVCYCSKRKYCEGRYSQHQPCTSREGMAALRSR